MPPGRVFVSAGSNALMRSTTAMMFAPGCRCTFTITAGVSFIDADWWRSSGASTTAATLLRRTGAPFLYAITKDALSALESS